MRWPEECARGPRMTEAISSTFIRLFFYICSNKNGKSSKINKKRLNAELLRGERAAAAAAVAGDFPAAICCFYSLIFPARVRALQRQNVSVAYQ
jgi:hypothetical protein